MLAEKKIPVDVVDPDRLVMDVLAVAVLAFITIGRGRGGGLLVQHNPCNKNLVVVSKIIE